MSTESKREKLLREKDEARRVEADRGRLESHLKQPGPLGCGDSSCVVAARGMMTTGVIDARRQARAQQSTERPCEG